MGPTLGSAFHWPSRACVLGNEVLLPAWALGDQPGCQPSQVWLLGRTSPPPGGHPTRLGCVPAAVGPTGRRPPTPSRAQLPSRGAVPSSVQRWSGGGGALSDFPPERPHPATGQESVQGACPQGGAWETPGGAHLAVGSRHPRGQQDPHVGARGLPSPQWGGATRRAQNPKPLGSSHSNFN